MLTKRNRKGIVMVNRTRAIDHNEKASLSDIAKELYQHSKAGGLSRALFFGKMDELFLIAAQDPHARDTSLNSMIEYYWREFFPMVTLDVQVENLVFKYIRLHRDWIWAVYKRKKEGYPSDKKQLEMVLKLRSYVSHDMYSRDELQKICAEPYYQDEITVFWGDSAHLSSKEAEAITNDRLISELKAIYQKWIENTVDMQSVNAERDQRSMRTERHKQSIPGKSADNMFADPQLDQVCLQFVVMELVSKERARSGMHTGALVEDAMENLWDVMPEEIGDRRSDWVSFASTKIYGTKILRPLLSRKYSEIRDVGIKENVRIRICTAHTIAESEDFTLSNNEITERVCRVLHEAYNMDPENRDLIKSIQIAVKQYYPSDSDAALKKRVWSFMNERKARVDTWYKWIIQKDKSMADKESADIARMWADYNERLYLAENSVRKEAIADLIRGLSERSYGNILAEMYLISRDRSREDPVEVLRNFFMVLRNMDFGLEPFFDGNSSYPGWKINGEIIVDPNREE